MSVDAASPDTDTHGYASTTNPDTDSHGDSSAADCDAHRDGYANDRSAGAQPLHSDASSDR